MSKKYDSLYAKCLQKHDTIKRYPKRMVVNKLKKDTTD